MDDLAWAYMKPYNTGLPMAIWIGQHGYRRPPRGIRQTIRVNRQHGSIPEYIDIEEAETAGIDVETGEVTDGSLASGDLDPVKQWLVVNLQFLTQEWFPLPSAEKILDTGPQATGSPTPSKVTVTQTDTSKSSAATCGDPTGFGGVTEPNTASPTATQQYARPNSGTTSTSTTDTSSRTDTGPKADGGRRHHRQPDGDRQG
jgi:hypothetical protein